MTCFTNDSSVQEINPCILFLDKEQYIVVCDKELNFELENQNCALLGKNTHRLVFCPEKKKVYLHQKSF